MAGDSKTLLIIQVSPDFKELSETVSTLQFGTHVMKVEKGKAKSCILQEVDTNTANSSVIKSMVLPSSPSANDNSKMKVSKSTASLNGKFDSPSTSGKVEAPPVTLQLKESNNKEKDKENGSSAKASGPQPIIKAPKVSSFIKPGSAQPKKGRSATLTDANQLVHVIEVARFKRDGSGMELAKHKVNTSLSHIK